MTISDLSPWWALLPFALWAVGGFLAERIIERRRHNLIRKRIKSLRRPNENPHPQKDPGEEAGPVA